MSFICLGGWPWACAFFLESTRRVMFKSVMIRGVLACQAGGRLLLFSCPYLYVLSVFDAAIRASLHIDFAFIPFLREAVSDKTARARANC